MICNFYLSVAARQTVFAELTQRSIVLMVGRLNIIKTNIGCIHLGKTENQN